MHRDAVNAVADLGVRVGNLFGPQSAVDRLPGLAGVVAPERARCRDGDEDPSGLARIEEDRVQAHAAGAWLPKVTLGAAQSGKFLPGLAAVHGAEQGGVFRAGVDGIGIGERRFEMPDSLELPRVLRAVVPLVGAGDAVVDELVPDRLPRFAAVFGALNHLAEPAAGLRRIEPVRINGRALEVIDFPAGKVGAADLPLFALAVRGQDERALAGADQYSDCAHWFLRSHRSWARGQIDCCSHVVILLLSGRIALLIRWNV